jgi:hypothetical protein
VNSDGRLEIFGVYTPTGQIVHDWEMTSSAVDDLWADNTN